MEHLIKVLKSEKKMIADSASIKRGCLTARAYSIEVESIRYTHTHRHIYSCKPVTRNGHAETIVLGGDICKPFSSDL